MSPTRRGVSGVDGLRRGVGHAPEPAPAAPAAVAGKPAARGKDARITLNLPADLYRQLVRWTDGAAEAINVPRVGVQDALRAMIRVMTDDSSPNATARVLTQLRQERA
jgi:hypothetical protein